MTIPRKSFPLMAVLVAVVVLLACNNQFAPVTPTQNAITKTFVANVITAISVGQTQTAQAHLGPVTLTPSPVESAFAPGNPTAAPPFELTRWAETQTALGLTTLPVESILILAPGPGSQITSPVSIAGISNPTFENNLVIEIQDERGNVLGSATTTITADLGQRGPFELTLEFSPPASPKAGRITIADYSARDGHVIHYSTTPVTLLPVGSAADLKSGSEHPEEIAIASPAFSDVISGGTLRVSGFAAATFEGMLNIVVRDANGVIVGIGTATIEADVGQPGPFEGEVTYSVASEQPGAVQVSAVSPRDGGLLHLSSVEVTLRP